jgi:hypothetical protein
MDFSGVEKHASASSWYKLNFCPEDGVCFAGTLANIYQKFDTKFRV